MALLVSPTAMDMPTTRLPNPWENTLACSIDSRCCKILAQKAHSELYRSPKPNVDKSSVGDAKLLTEVVSHAKSEVIEKRVRGNPDADQWFLVMPNLLGGHQRTRACFHGT